MTLMGGAHIGVSKSRSRNFNSYFYVILKASFKVAHSCDSLSHHVMISNGAHLFKLDQKNL